MTYQNIIFSIEGNVATITFNRPEVQNGFNVPMCQEILDAIRVVKETDEARVLVFKAEGKGLFCRWRPNRNEARCRRRRYGVFV